MKKLVNGKVIEIKNIELFEYAAEGAAIGRTLPNIIPSDGLGINFNMVESIIDIYKNFYSVLPFPLYSIDSDLKYCSAGLVIKKETKLKNKMWTNEGLFICIDEERKLCLGFVNESWGIVKVDKILNDNIVINIYKEYTGFEEYIWVLANLFKDNGTNDYYKVFMPQFVEACGNQPVVMRWELGNMLQFGNIPDRLILPENKILDLNNGSTYSLDIFVAGTRETSEKVQTWSMKNDYTDSNHKKVNVYGYDLYMKPNVKSSLNKRIGGDKLKATELYGINSLFCTLCYIKSNDESDSFSSYKGFIDNDNLVYMIDNRIFIARSKNYVEAQEIAKGVDIYSYSNNSIYIEKPKNIAMGIKKETIYSYSLEDKNLRLCKIQFARI